MKVSIITATYNSAATVADTMRSVQAQDYPFVEHIVVDGLSKDNTLEIVRSFPHVEKIISEKDSGIYDAMNKGIGAASGDIIGILNSDDMYTDETVLSKVAQVFRDPSVQACYADIQYIDAQDVKRVRRTWRSGRYTLRSFYWGWMPPHPSFFVRKSVYEKVGLYKTKFQSAADYEMMLRILLKHKMPAAYIPEVIVKMRTGGISNATIRNRLQANRDDREAWRMNELRPYFFTLYLKPMRKVTQFLIK